MSCIKWKKLIYDNDKSFVILQHFKNAVFPGLCQNEYSVAIVWTYLSLKAVKGISSKKGTILLKELIATMFTALYQNERCTNKSSYFYKLRGMKIYEIVFRSIMPRALK